MKKESSKAEVKKFNRLSKAFSLSFIAVLIAFVPLVVFLKLYGAAIWAILFLAVLAFAFKIEKIKKDNDLYTYKEIVAFSEGKHLDELQAQREIGKRPYQTALKFLMGAAVGIILAAAASIMLKLIK